jgi:hypothetical protein
MVKPLLSAVVVISAVAIFGLVFPKGTNAQASAPAGVRTPVVVELFTSEGCSSCPPADQLLAKLEAEQSIQNAEVIALEEHVDYWNNLGWTDPFSSESSTLRQYVYAEALGNGNAYTPQMVVDGQDEFVGSRERQARGAIGQAASRRKAEVMVTAGNRESEGSQVFRIKTGALPNLTAGDTAEVWMAITETGLHSDVKRGENAGEDLHHAAVVRELSKIGQADGSGENSFSAEKTLKLDRNWKRENTRVVVFLQEKKSKRILGAGSALAGR